MCMNGPARSPRRATSEARDRQCHHRLHQEQRQADLGNHDHGGQGLTGANKGALAGMRRRTRAVPGADKVWP